MRLFNLVFILLSISLSAEAQSVDTLYKKEGTASYYAKKFHGRKTANGDIFHVDSLTAAHKTLPFGTMVKVTNLKNQKSVIVRINDRGMVGKKRVIDLSPAAAKAIGMIHSGLQKVRVEELPPPNPVNRALDNLSAPALRQD
jgi:rare lipoprotein A